MKLLQQGAEAKIYLTSENTILKSRTAKSYRHPKLDKQLINKRTKREAKILAKCQEAKINTPKLLHQDKSNLQLEHISGEKLSQHLNNYEEEKQISKMKLLGKEVAKLHQENIIHSDLTTSNVIYSNSKIYIIDFGLSYISTKLEDKAVDLHLLKQALEAKHHKNHELLFASFLKGYSHSGSKKIIERLNTVEKRGRYKRSKKH